MVNYRGKGKAKAAHRPPARVRYEQSHPTVSCRLSKDEYDLLKQCLDDLGGVSFADFVKNSLNILQLRIPETRETKERARRAGYDEAKKKHQIWYYCDICNQRIDVLPDSVAHKAMIKSMRENGWGHKRCHEQ
jgi:hypothetical protein